MRSFDQARRYHTRWRIVTQKPDLITATGRYLTRFRIMFACIDTYLEDILDVDGLAGVAAFSRHYFHRQFLLLFGMNVRRYVQLLRLERVVYQLVCHDNARIIDIALVSGYRGPGAFTQAFRRQTGQSLSTFRAAPQWTSWAIDLQALRALRSQHIPAQPQTQSIKTVEREIVAITTIGHRGNPACLSETLRTLIVWHRRHRLHLGVSVVYNVVYSSPDNVPLKALRTDVCVAMHASVALSVADIAGKTLAGGHYAVPRHTGSNNTLGQNVTYLYAN